jgi:outer membrane protein assembly factor BamB
VTFALLLAASFADAPADWPQWRGPNRDGHSPEKGLLRTWPKDGPAVAWAVPGRGKGFASVVVSGGTVYGSGHRGGKEVVWALDEKSGKEKWASAINPANATPPGDGCRGTPTVAGGRVYAIGFGGDFGCLDAKSGKNLWAKSFSKDFGGRMMSGWGYCESPLVDGDKVIVTPGGDKAAVVALDAKTGKTLWTTEIKGADGAGYASPVKGTLGGIPYYLTLLGKAGGLVAVHADTGKLLFRYTKVSNGTANIPTPIIKGDLVFTSTGYGDGGSALLKLTAADGGISAAEVKRYASGELQNHHGGMILVGEHLFLGRGHNNGLPTCVTFDSAEIAWQEDRNPGGGSGSAAVAYADGMLIFRYENGRVALVAADPKEFKLLASFAEKDRSGDPAWAHPTVANGKLYLRDQDKLRVYKIK